MEIPQPFLYISLRAELCRGQHDIKITFSLKICRYIKWNYELSHIGNGNILAMEIIT